MTWYFIRVEFQKRDNCRITSDDFKFLHLEMKKKGFLRYLPSSMELTNTFLTAEYYKASDINIEEVMEDARAASFKTKRISGNIKSYSVFTLQFDRW